MRIVVAGGSGFLGTALIRRLQADGHAITVLTRTPTAAHDVQWDPYRPSGSWVRTLQDADAVINLAGASISKRWSAEYKREMWNSRVLTTRTLVTAMKGVANGPVVLLNGSAVGIYGSRDDEQITEKSSPGSGFLPSLARDWEGEAVAAVPQARVVLLRSGIVLDGDGGALPQMAMPFRLFVGGPIASGRQYFSWIHRDDWVSMVAWALTNSRVTGALNVTAPFPITNGELSRTLGRVLHRPAILPVPGFVLRVVVGEMAGELINGQRVFPAKAASLGFEFRYPQIETALQTIYRD